MKQHTLQFNRTIKQHRQIIAKLRPTQNPASVLYEDFPDITVYKPQYTANNPLPTVLYIPGNAFVASETDYTHFICSHITEQSRCQVILIKHPLAPEHPFPQGFNKVNDTVKLLLLTAKNPFHLQIDKERVTIVGYSSGGNFAALMTIQAKKMGIPIARQMLISPITDLSRTPKGFEIFEHQDTAINEAFVKWFLNLYIPKNITLVNPKISPYWAKKRALSALPPTDIMFGEMDYFRGDAELYGKKLRKAGTIVHSLLWKQENHGFLWHNHKVINMIASRLAVTFGTETIARPLKSRIKENGDNLSYPKTQSNKQKLKNQKSRASTF